MAVKSKSTATPKKGKTAARNPGPAVAARKAPPAAAKKAAPRKANGGEMTAIEQQAFRLSEAAILLDQARTGNDKRKLAEALNADLECWCALRTAVARPEAQIGEATKQNLLRLADYVTGTIMSAGAAIKGSTVDTLININLQISEGLLEGHTAQRVRERAYRIWENEGCPHGRDMEHWLQAEREIRGR
jgi:flagellar biosynthesis regulator FlaF